MDECAQNRRLIAEALRDCSELIIALGDETRQQIIITLLESDRIGLRVGEITEKTHLSRPAVSHHLKLLREAGIITVRHSGTMNFYYMDANYSKWEQLNMFISKVCEIISRANDSGYPENDKNFKERKQNEH